jgi:hypothetical protein
MASERKKKPKTDAELWDTLQADAELERIKHLSAAEVAAEIRAEGGDPEAIARRGGATAAKLLAERAADWRTRASARREAMGARIGEWPSFASLPRHELSARLAAARVDPRLSAPVVAAFRKRTEDDATDDELRAILEEIEVLRRLHPSKDP